MDANQIFRKAALDRMSSPEQLDQLVRVTAPRTWLALAALLLCLAGALGWGYWGRIVTTVEAAGTLSSGGTRFVPSPLAGQVSDLRVASGDPVAAGQIVAVVAPPFLLDRLRAARTDASELALLEQQLNASGSVISPYEGRVDHVTASVGATVPAGAPIVTLQREHDRTEAVLYLASGPAQEVRRGMPVTIRYDGESHTVPALVEFVAAAPTAAVTPAGPTPRGAGPLIAIYAVATVNVRLPAQAVPCRAEIVTREQRPLSLVIPGVGPTPSR